MSIGPEGLLHDAERGLLAIDKSIVACGRDVRMCTEDSARRPKTTPTCIRRPLQLRFVGFRALMDPIAFGQKKTA